MPEQSQNPDLRYPVGKFHRPKAPLTETERASAIAEMADLPAKIREAVNGLTDAQLDTPYRPDGWTVRQVVHHLADSHLNCYCRFRLGITEENPTIKPYAENEWSNLVDARTFPVNASLEMLDGLHGRLDVLLKSLKPSDFSRTLQHPETGAQTLDTLVALYAWHSRHHTGHVTELRRRQGW